MEACKTQIVTCKIGVGFVAGHPLRYPGTLEHARAPQVFTTCGSAAKRAFLQKTFPWLEDTHIGDSRSTSFEATVLGQACVHPVPCAPYGAAAPGNICRAAMQLGRLSEQSLQARPWGLQGMMHAPPSFLVARALPLR